MTSSSDSPRRLMPDVALEAHPDRIGALDRVGMDGIEMPVLVTGADGQVQRVAARVEAWVDLARPDVRGIHMSRLYLHADRHLSAEPLAPAALRRLLRDFLDSHADLSGEALIRIRFDHLLRRQALASAHSGWRAYPVSVAARLRGSEFQVELGIEVQYSSTCPASAALARQLIQDQFARDFASGPLERDAVLAWLGSEQGIVATPHSQRSTARVRVRLAPGFDFPLADLIDAAEAALQTPVQTAVKREDEQEFALRNGQNLMFCEDAARRIRQVLDGDERITDFWLRTAHHESLHPHDAVAFATKGVSGGYRVDDDG
ncbi:GTP cyclohydrolase FolE2 [Dokdonella sp.]|uniref:GTP cyclohydrolase FolE2 n=1 Tax=Dokdonella sp. TaxID=2291710 RepID=UPI0031CAD3A5|nr:GTP cyclohydrolase FolE2 [Dokdonella sp.]